MCVCVFVHVCVHAWNCVSVSVSVYTVLCMYIYACEYCCAHVTLIISFSKLHSLNLMYLPVDRLLTRS